MARKSSAKSSPSGTEATSSSPSPGSEAAPSSVAWKGPEALRTLLRPIAELRADPRNARKHPERNLAAIQESLGAFGQQKPTVIRTDGTHVAGSGTLEAARNLGWTHLAVVTFDGDAEDAIRYGIADNRTGDLAVWDSKMLAELLEEVGAENGGVPGWTQDDIAELLDGIKLPERTVNTVEELAQMREATMLRQIVLVMQAAEYERVLDELERAQAELGADSNADVVLHLLREYAATKGRTL